MQRTMKDIKKSVYFNISMHPILNERNYPIEKQIKIKYFDFCGDSTHTANSISFLKK